MDKKRHLSFGFSFGFELIEVIVGAAVITLSLAAIISMLLVTLRESLAAPAELKAAALAEEGLEALRALRNQSFASQIAALSVDTPYHLSFAGGAWQVSLSGGYIDGEFDRTLLFESVYRRTSDSDIVDAASPDTKALDADARKATVTVSWWEGNATSTVSAATYLTNLYDN